MVVEQYTAATATDKIANEQENLLESKPERAAGGMDTTSVHGEIARRLHVMMFYCGIAMLYYLHGSYMLSKAEWLDVDLRNLTCS
jgi:hypothetical protein